MFYIKRNTQGEVVMLSKERSLECAESISPDSPEVLAFLASQPGSAANFLASDLAFVRVVEDILAVLLEKGIISFTDLPAPAQRKVMERQSLRAKNDVGLLSDDDTI
ncbi:tryptophan synthase subunit beta like protein [Vreelandella nanhaiensis]|uniref:Tryptophan synthase subunit beta like protein n=1 Tax=Vreelandella nanhaiensis TaxID=1258546 RepID=A0A433KRU2_9GAMM|nr:tryptophan synthase subunit beta like protein [Halomonas nanhaiensis]RUR32302.1 tryptophan synthase subunit beta like protein [Halomonas nanhaiensis]